MLSWNSNTLATSCEELTHWKRLWCWEGLGAGGEGDNRGWNGWMASPTGWTWVWVSSGSWWWTGKTGVLQSMGLQRVELDWVTELIWSCEEVGKYEICYCRWFRQSAQALFFSSKLPMGISCWHVAPIINSRTMWGKQTSSGTQGKKSKTNCLLKHTLV